MNELSIPFGRCHVCLEDMPVLLVQLSEFQEPPPDLTLLGNEVLVFCSVCETLLNARGNITISYYDERAITGLGWALAPKAEDTEE